VLLVLVLAVLTPFQQDAAASRRAEASSVREDGAQGLWQLPMLPIKSGPGNHDLRSKRTPTISVLMSTFEEYLTPWWHASIESGKRLRLREEQ